MKSIVFGAVTAILVASPAYAAEINASATGLSTPVTTITFSELGIAPNTPITNQYAGLGVTFSGGAFQSPQSGFPNDNGDGISNFSFAGGGGPFNPITLSFGPARSGAAFSVNSNFSPFTFTALLGGSVVDSFTATVGSNSFNNFFGFEGVNFDAIVINSGDYFIIDNLQLGTAAGVPEPATWAMMIGGFALVGGALRRRPGKLAII